MNSATKASSIEGEDEERGDGRDRPFDHEADHRPERHVYAGKMDGLRLSLVPILIAHTITAHRAARVNARSVLRITALHA